MTKPIPIRVPQEVVNDTSVRVISLSCATGQQVSSGHPLVELETSKSNIQVESPTSGWLQVLCKVGDELPVGGLIGQLFDTLAALDAACQPTFSPSQTTPVEVSMNSVVTAESGVTVFSDRALSLLRASGLDEAMFKGHTFVCAADVQALLRDKAVLSVPVEASAVPPAPSPASDGTAINPEDTTFEQTFADNWPLWMLIRSDLHRIDGCHTNAHLLHQWFRNPAFRFIFWFRIAQWARTRAWAKLLIHPVAVMLLWRCHYQTGIRIPLSIKAGPGLLIGHWGSIWISPSCMLGANCTLSNDINLGSAGDGGKDGAPQIGDNVFIGPGARIAGAVEIGHNTAIMANTLVTTNVPSGSIVIGVPHRISGHRNTNTYVSHTDYPHP